MKPSDLPEVNRRLAREYRKGNAPVVELIKPGGAFKILVAAILSSRTRDEVTAAAAKRLFAAGSRPGDLARMPVPDIRQLIFPVGFYRQKAVHLKSMAQIIQRDYANRVPDKLEALLDLPGVGRKTAALVLSTAFNQAAICVDIHVHRISNRLGLVNTTTPLATETALREILPKRYWRTWNRYLVAFGQTRCLPRRPRCRGCPLYVQCDRKPAATGRLQPGQA